MSSFRSLLTNMRTTREGSAGLPLVVGLVIGLIFGLLIGWVLWPVEWQGAYINELLPSARADYLAAVADSYVYSQSPESLAVAAQRLEPLHASLDAEINAAIAHFRSQASTDSNIRMMNLTQLANALAVPLDQTALEISALDASAATVAAQPLVVEITATAVDPAASAATVNNVSQVEETGFRLLPFLLRVLLALVLIAGGLALFRWLAQQRDGQAVGGMAGVLQAMGWNRVASSHNVSMVGRTAQGDDEYEFDAEGDEDASTNRPADGNLKIGWSRSAVDFAPSGAAATTRKAGEYDLPLTEPTEDWDAEVEDEEPPLYQATGRRRVLEEDVYQHGDSFDQPVESLEEEYLDEDDLEGDELDEEVDDAMPPARNQGRTPPDTPPAPSQRFVNEDRFPPLNDDATRGIINRSSSFSPPPTPPTPPAPTARQRNSETPAPKIATQKTPDRRIAPGAPGNFAVGGFTGVKPVESFSFHYQFGDFDYSQAYPINDAAGKNYIGECGMGVSTKNAILHKNSDEVIALEVWLFDKADDRSLSNQMRVLLSEYADTHYLDAFNRDRNGEVRPFVAQPGTRFQLEGKNLLLNGEILEAKYSREGIFQSVKVKADILRR